MAKRFNGLRGASTGYDTSIFLRLPTEQPTFRASVSSAGRYFPEFEEFVPGRQTAEAMSSVATELGRSTTLNFTGSGRYTIVGGGDTLHDTARAAATVISSAFLRLRDAAGPARRAGWRPESIGSE